MANELNIQPAPNWGGVPYAQGTTFGQPLSPYANLVDQIYAASQPMPTGMQFGRWAFGGGGGQTMPGQGQTQGQMPTTPPPGVGPQQVGGLLGGQSPSPQLPAGWQAPRPSANPQQTTASGGQLSFGNTPFGQNYSYLMNQYGPAAAMTYLLDKGLKGPDSQAIQQQMTAQLGVQGMNDIINQYNGGVGGTNYRDASWRQAALPVAVQPKPPVAGFGTPKPTGAMPGAGVSLTGSSPYVAAFNKLMQTQGPQAAYSYLFKNYGANAGRANEYGFGGYGGAGTQLEKQLGSTAFHQLVNAYNVGGSNYRPEMQFAGLPSQNDNSRQQLAYWQTRLGNRLRTGLLGG